MRELAARMLDTASDISSDVVLVVKDDDPKKRDGVAARIEDYLLRIRSNEDMRTFVHRRDEPGKTSMLIGLGDHDAKSAIVKALWNRAEREADKEGVQVWTKELSMQRKARTAADKAATLDARVMRALVEMGAIPALGTKVAGPIRWQAVFFMGAAGAGKSFVKTKKYLRHLDFKEVDPDEIKKSHPDYDPNNPFALHGWSKELADRQLKKLITDGSGSPVIVDQTGRDAGEITKKMKLAEENGYRTFLVYVYVPLSVSLWRNRNRKRFVPEEILISKAAIIKKNYGRLKSIADKSKVILNYEKPEEAKAEADLRLYPAPWKGPPVRPPRPWMDVYGKSQRELIEMGWTPADNAGEFDGRIVASLLKIARELLEED